jgi:hypothetical protein
VYKRVDKIMNSNTPVASKPNYDLLINVRLLSFSHRFALVMLSFALLKEFNPIFVSRFTPN